MSVPLRRSKPRAGRISVGGYLFSCMWVRPLLTDENPGACLDGDVVAPKATQALFVFHF